MMLRRSAVLPYSDSCRRISLFSLKSRSDPDDLFIFCSDGQSTAAFAEAYYREHASDLVWFIGVDCSDENRNAEYVIGRDQARFRQHESFFTREVLSWVQDQLGIQHSKARSSVFGYSCGGAFAASMGIRHPDLFQTIFAFSIAGRPIAAFDSEAAATLHGSKFYLRSGSREPSGMKSYMRRLETWLRGSGATVDQTIESGGHNFTLWSSALNSAIQHAFFSV